MAADGSIVIDTKVNTGGLNAGVKAVSNSFSGLQGAVKKTTQSLAQAFLGGKNFATIFKNIAKFAAAAFIGGSVISSIRNLADSFDLASSSIGDKVKPLSAALETLKGTFVNLIVTAFVPLIPYLISAAQWFTNILQTVTQVVAALFGYKQTIGNIMTKAASDAKKATKEVKGALAAFDQINVLQKHEGPEAVTGPEATPPPITIPDDLLDRARKLKDLIMAWFSDPIGMLKKTWGQIVEWFKLNVLDPIVKWWNSTWIGQLLGKLWENFTTTWGKIFQNTVETFLAIKENITIALGGVRDFIVGIFTADFPLALQGLQAVFFGVFGALRDLIVGSLTNWGILYSGWIENIKILFLSLAPVFLKALDWIKSGFITAFGGIRDWVRNVINDILGFINSMISSIMEGIAAVAGLMGNGPGAIGGAVASASLRAPRLATGAVIPPHANMLAMIGEGSQREIVAPEDTIRRIIREELGGSGEMSITMPVYLDGEKIYQNQQRVQTRHGKSLIAGKR